jgi:hypothetical protein
LERSRRQAAAARLHQWRIYVSHLTSVVQGMNLGILWSLGKVRCAAREIMRRQSRGSRTGWRCGLGSERLAPRGPSPPLLMPYAARPPPASASACRSLPAVPPTAAATYNERTHTHTAHSLLQIDAPTHSRQLISTSQFRKSLLIS